MWSQRNRSNPTEYPAMWDQRRQSIYEFLADFEVEEGQWLPEPSMDLPDEGTFATVTGTKLRFLPGAFDGNFLRHGVATETDVERLVRLVEEAVNGGSARRRRAFYDAVLGESVLPVAEALRERLVERQKVQPEQLRRFALWLVTSSPDRNPVKFGIFLLSLCGSPQDARVLMRLGVHEEFTLYVASALGTLLPPEEAEQERWWLARRVIGWGRITLVERLASTDRDDIKAWLLREGYRNSVMYKYLAYTCAVHGGLLDALRAEQVDEALLRGASDILAALIAQGPPAEDITDYAEGPEVIERLLEHLAHHEPARPAICSAIADIRDFTADDGRDWESLSSFGWDSARRVRITAAANALLSDPRWAKIVTAGLEAANPEEFWDAGRAADKTGVDAWPARFARLDKQSDDSVLFHLMQTTDPARAEQVIEWARNNLDLTKLNVGPGPKSGVDVESAEACSLDWILQDLNRFPGLGWDLIQVGLQSPAVNNRFMAIRALSGWKRSDWPQEARPALLAAMEVEPDAEAKELLSELLHA